MFVYTKRRALITGASSGIGKRFAKELARRGMDLVIVARSKEALEELAKSLQASYSVSVVVLVADLNDRNSLEKLITSLHERDLHVDLLVNNAGFATYGPFVSSERSEQRGQIDLNIGALTELTRAVLPQMVERRSGGIINVASTVAFQPVPCMAVYGATKAFVISFSEAIAIECRQENVQVVALCPGPTDTAFFKKNDVQPKNMRTTQQVVLTGLAALERGQTVVVDGLANSIQSQLAKIAPRKLSARIAEKAVDSLYK